MLTKMYRIMYHYTVIKTLPITKAREELPTLVDKASKLLDEYVITVNGIPTAILMSVSEYESWKETMEILSDPQLVSAIHEGEEDLKKKKVYDWEKIKKDFHLDV